MPPGLVPPFGPQPDSPHQRRCSRDIWLSRHHRQDQILPSSVKSTDRLTSAHYYNLFFQSCTFCRPDSLALPMPMRFSLTVLLSLDNFTEGIIVVALASDCLSVLLANYYSDSLLLGHPITAFNLFSPHAEDWSQRRHILEHLSQSSVQKHS